MEPPYWGAGGAGLEIVPLGGGGSVDCGFAGRAGGRLGCAVAVPVDASRCAAEGSGPAGSVVMMFTGGIEAEDGKVYFEFSGTPVAVEPGGWADPVSADVVAGAGGPPDGVAAAGLAPSGRQLAA